jgi:FKBP-type peptidyl-prolyl cis-trans isomerase FkpA
MKRFLIVLFLASLGLQAQAQDAKPACAAPAAAPKELVKKDIEPGTGREVKAGTAVLVGYTGWLYDGCAKDLKGKKFDTSEGRATPFGVMVGAGKVIKGWDQGLLGMKEKGSKRTLVIPPDLAYGDKGVGNGLIPPNSTLVFDVEVFQIVHYPADPAPAAPAAPAKK